MSVICPGCGTVHSEDFIAGYASCPVCDCESGGRGWGLFESDARGLEIQRIDAAARFESDAAALDFVVRHPAHAKACILEALANARAEGSTVVTTHDHDQTQGPDSEHGLGSAQDRLARCPCGQVPTRLSIAQGDTLKWAFTYGDCCGEWHVEFRTKYLELQSPQCMALAVAAWNTSPRSPSR